MSIGIMGIFFCAYFCIVNERKRGLTVLLDLLIQTNDKRQMRQLGDYTHVCAWARTYIIPIIKLTTTLKVAVKAVT